MLVLFLIALVPVFARADDLCTPKYAAIKPTHAACFVDSPDLIKAGVSEDEKKTIVDLHNKLRRNVVVDAGVPTNLQQVVWDDKIAAIAEKNVKRCVMKHGKRRNVLEYPGYVGQNIARGFGDWSAAVNAWYDEIKYFKYGVKVPEKTGHFSQVVSSRVSHIGCGFALCKSGKYYACNYYRGQMSKLTPFKPGKKRCSACGANCVNGLCAGECLNKLCLNTGALNIGTCQCECKLPYVGKLCETQLCPGKKCLNGGTMDYDTCKCKCNDPYTGDTCESKNCPADEHIICGTVWKPDSCKYSNVQKDCLKMCGTCPGKVVRYNSPSGCEYHGVKKSAKQCATLKKDMYMCASNGGTWGCKQCTSFSNVPEACPQTCGLCP